MESIIDRHNLTRIDDVMSNFDHIIERERDIEERLRKGDCYAGKSAYNFHGNVMFKNNKFVCEIKRYSSLVDIIEGDTLEKIMEESSNTYGWD